DKSGIEQRAAPQQERPARPLREQEIQKGRDRKKDEKRQRIEEHGQSLRGGRTGAPLHTPDARRGRVDAVRRQLFGKLVLVLQLLLQPQHLLLQLRDRLPLPRIVVQVVHLQRVAAQVEQ